MKFRFFGGANEIGASSTLIEIDGHRILVDAGIRMGPGQDSQLPDFPDFDNMGMPDAVLLTHAHADHTGALPRLENLWLAGVKIYWTPATRAITRVSLEHNAKRMQREEQEEGKPPLYTCDDVEIVLHGMEKEVPWFERVPICGDVKATWIPAGHILGAAMIYIEGRNESILITGDVSVSKQLTIPSVEVPQWCKSNVMVMESTYGNCYHKVTRNEVEKRLVEDVTETIAAGGKVLIPVFAVGRSQEVILILKRAMELKKIPVCIDGMVHDVNKVYQRFSDDLQPELKHKMERAEDLFYSDTIRPIRSNEERSRILSGEPCVIIASSGMLVGGRSSSYAKHLATNPKNLITLTGYQAKGTPGRELWDWVEAGRPPDRMWQLKAQEPVSVKCQVKKYSLSAHADSDELMGLVAKVQPRKLFLVHGDDDDRKKLAESVREKYQDIDVKLPENGETYTVKKHIGLAAGRHFANDRILSELSASLQKIGLNGPFRVRELAEMWFGSEAITTVVVKFFEWCLSLDRQFFKRKSGDLFHLRQPI